MLTGKQHQLLSYLIDYQAEKDITPSFDEMRAAIGLASKSGIHRLVSALEERGYIRKLPNRARAIEILRHPGNGPEAYKASTNVITISPSCMPASTIESPTISRAKCSPPATSPAGTSI